MAKTSTSANTPPYSFSSFVELVNNNFIIVLLVGLTFVGGFFIGSLWTENQILRSGGRVKIAAEPSGGDAVLGDQAAPTGPQGPTADQLANVPEITSEDHVRGDRNADIMLIEYSDFECPFCASFHPTMKAVLDKYDGQVAWVYRNFPLSFHPSAEPLAVAAECVAKIGGEDAYWSYADALFERQGQITAANAAEVAGEFGLSTSAVQDCMDNQETLELVQEQFSAGGAAGISGTPGTILVTKNGDYELISGALPQAQVEQVIDGYLN